MPDTGLKFLTIEPDHQTALTRSLYAVRAAQAARSVNGRIPPDDIACTAIVFALGMLKATGHSADDLTETCASLIAGVEVADGMLLHGGEHAALVDQIVALRERRAAATREDV